ncbi:MAG: Transcriptional regulator, TetR [Amycolatopsis sp.]|jgi:TetR/AcrR family transcriptional repressor of nem operon|uniref:TetR/AcrR family transcriptional regulator n=1 Tax=Amycolatopsis sp. TaxID=37632 RepID=UPI002621D6C1|nr:TetR/AcrR family transcriptional regulator [Amycolatopsis sp.]MCU1683981.1 Transcriptional regulator, TetR [Amycolatopsis sp.]
MKALPTTPKGLRTRATIVGAAARLMHDRGLAAPSMDEVLVGSGTGKSQLYHYFDGKQDLAVAVLHHQFELVMAAQPALHDLSCDDLGRWRNEVLRAHRASGLGTCPLGVFVGQTDHDPVLRATLAELFARWQGVLSDLVSRAQAAGRVRADVDPATAGRALLTALQGGTILAHLHADPAPLAQALADAIAPLSGTARTREDT